MSYEVGRINRRCGIWPGLAFRLLNGESAFVAGGRVGWLEIDTHMITPTHIAVPISRRRMVGTLYGTTSHTSGPSQIPLRALFQVLRKIPKKAYFKSTLGKS